MSGSTIESFVAIDEKLAARGVPRAGDWWREALGAWYRHPTARTLGICAGRGSAKSTALYKVALNEALFGDFAIPPGERHAATITSRLREEAGKGIGIISHWLAILGVRHTPTDGLIELTDMPRDFRITSASVASNSGWRSFFDGDDEVGKWPAEGATAVDAAEVLSSKAAQCATHADSARQMIVGSPLFDAGPFFELITIGTNARQVVRVASTWVATDGRITEEQTHRLEKSPGRHAREYGAVFGSEWEHGYFIGLIEGAVGAHSSLPHNPRFAYTVAIDPAFGHDLFAIVVAHAEGDRVVVDRVEAMVPPRGGEGLSPTPCVRRVRDVVQEYRARFAITDQFSGATLTDLAAREGLHLEQMPWTGPNKAEKFERVRTLMRERPPRLVIPNDKPLLRELSGIGTRLRVSGHESIEARPGFTDDRVAALVLAVTAAEEGCNAGELARAVNVVRRRRNRGGGGGGGGAGGDWGAGSGGSSSAWG